MKTQFNRSEVLRKGWVFTVLLLGYLTASTQPSVLNKPENNKDNCESPYFLVLAEQGETEQLPLKSTNVDVNISGVIADVNVKQTYSNTGIKPIEAIYVFPASTRAAVYKMVMKVNDREIIAIVEEKQQARTMYEEAKNQGKTASLLEEHRPNVFQMNVANIMPGATIEVSMSYTELLIPTDKVYEFMYPTVVGPRYVSKNETESGSAENWTANPYTEEGVKPKSTLDIKVNIEAGMPIKEIRCETHKNKISYEAKSKANITLNEKDGGNRDFIVQYRLAGNSIESGVLLYEDPNGENYFLAMMQPPQRVTYQQIAPREYVFIIDVSGSMSGFPLDISKEIMRKLLGNLNSTDKFNIVLFAGGSKVYSEKSLPATKQNVSKAIDFMDNLRGGGGTELLSALKTAMELNPDDNYSRSFVILTDGYVSVEKQAFDYIRNNLGNANFFSFGIGSSVNRFLIEGLAHIGYGEPFIAVNKEEGNKLADKFTKYISTPLLTDIDMEISGFEAYDILPEKMPDLFAERPLIVSGKYKGTPQGSIKITGTSGSEKYNKIWTIKKEISSDKAQALKYLWAREKIRLISDYNNLRKNEEYKKEIIALGKNYNLLTEYTSFIAIDSEVSNESGNISTVKQPLPLPQGVSNAAVASTASFKSVNTRRLKQGYSQAASYDMVSIDDEAEFDEAEVFVLVEQMPKFQGGDQKDFIEYIQKHIIYPEKAKENGIFGRVFVQFVINEKGELVDIKIIRSIDPLLDNEVIRVLKQSPKWTPGKQRGKPVKTTMTIPIEFKITKT
jgi:Ca-activated chloride channel homolog